MVFEVDNTAESLIQEFESVIEGPVGKLDILDSNIAIIKDTIDDVSQSARALENLQQGYKKLTDEELPSFQNSMESIKNKIERLSQNYEERKNYLEEQIKKLATADKIQEVSDQLERTNNDIKMLDEQILLQQKELKNDLTPVASNIDNVEKNLNTLLNEQISTKQLFNSICKQVQAMNEYVSQLQGDLPIVANAVKKNSDALEAIKKYLEYPGYKRFFKGMEENKND